MMPDLVTVKKESMLLDEPHPTSAETYMGNLEDDCNPQMSSHVSRETIRPLLV